MQTIEAGGLTFQIENRTLGKDGGPALLVFGDVDGQRVQILALIAFMKRRITTMILQGRIRCIAWNKGPITFVGP